MVQSIFQTGLQNYLIFQPFLVNVNLGMVDLINDNLKESQNESIKPSPITNISFNPEIIYKYLQGKIKWKGICFKKTSISFIHGNVINLYITCDTWSRDLNTDFTLRNCLFGTMKLNANPDKFGYGSIGFDARSKF